MKKNEVKNCGPLSIELSGDDFYNICQKFIGDKEYKPYYVRTNWCPFCDYDSDFELKIYFVSVNKKWRTKHSPQYPIKEFRDFLQDYFNTNYNLPVIRGNFDLIFDKHLEIKRIKIID